MSIASLDHFLVGTSNLEAAAAQIASSTGVEPVRGGAHPKLGTANFLLSLGSGVYFELIRRRCSGLPCGAEVSVGQLM